MLNLDSPRWANLQHAYGAAVDIPELLRQLTTMPVSAGESEPWISLWSALAHQGDVRSASFAAVPHGIHALGISPSKADAVYFQFPAWVEICRRKKGAEIPEDLRVGYFQTLARLPSLAAEAAVGEWDAEFLACVLAAVAASKGDPIAAEAALEIVPDVARDFMD